MQKPNQLANSAKKWLARGARFLVLTVPALVLAAPTYAAEGAGGGMNWSWLNDVKGLIQTFSLTKAATESMLGILNVIVGGLLALIYSVAQKIATQAIVGGQRILLESDSIHTAWTITLATTNSLLLLALAIMAILIMTGLQNYNIKKALTALIYALAVSNLSYDIVFLLLDMGDALRDGIVAAFTSFGASSNPGVEWLDSMHTMFYPYHAGFLEKLTRTNEELILQTLTSLATMAIGAYVMVRLSFLMIERAVRLALSIVLAPLLFVLQLFPGVGLEGLAKNWWSDVIKWILVLPAVYLLLSIAGLITKGHTIKLAEGLTQVVNSGTQSIIADLILSIAAISLTLAAASVPSLLGLKASSDGFFKPIDGLIKKGGGFVKDLTIGAGWNKLMAAGAEGRNNLADGKVSKWFGIALKQPNPAGGDPIPTKTGAFLQKFNQGSRSMLDTVANVQRTSKENKEKPGKIQEENLAKIDVDAANKLNIRIDTSALDLYRTATGNPAATMTEFKNDDEALKKHRKEVLDADPGLASRSKTLNKSAKKYLEEEADKDIEKGTTTDEAVKDAKKNRDAIKSHEEALAGGVGTRLSDADLSKAMFGLSKADKILQKLSDKGGEAGEYAARMRRGLIVDPDPTVTAKNMQAYRTGVTGYYRPPATVGGRDSISDQEIETLAQLETEQQLRSSRVNTRRTSPTNAGLQSVFRAIEQSEASEIEKLVTDRATASADLLTDLSDYANNTGGIKVAINSTIGAKYKNMTNSRKKDFKREMRAALRIQDPTARKTAMTKLLGDYKLSEGATADAQDATANMMSHGIRVDRIDTAAKLNQEAAALPAGSPEMRRATEFATDYRALQTANDGLNRLGSDISRRLPGASVVLSRINSQRTIPLPEVTVTTPLHGHTATALATSLTPEQLKTQFDGLWRRIRSEVVAQHGEDRWQGSGAPLKLAQEMVDAGTATFTTDDIAKFRQQAQGVAALAGNQVLDDTALTPEAAALSGSGRNYDRLALGIHTEDFQDHDNH